MRRKRYQKGSLQVVATHGKRKMWVLLYRDGGSKKYAHAGPVLEDEQERGAGGASGTFMKEVNARTASAPDPHITFGDFLEGAALPFLRSKWKALHSRHHGKPHPSSPTGGIRPGEARTPRTQGGCRRSLATRPQRSPKASWRICGGICGRYSGSRWRKAIPSATRPAPSSPRKRQRTA